jgi:hypothetical protein
VLFRSGGNVSGFRLNVPKDVDQAGSVAPVAADDGGKESLGGHMKPLIIKGNVKKKHFYSIRRSRTQMGIFILREKFAFSLAN